GGAGDAASAGAASADTGFNAGVATGNQVSPVVQVPVTACGNAVAIGGFANATCGGTTSTNPGGGYTGGGMGTGGGYAAQGAGMAVQGLSQIAAKPHKANAAKHVRAHA